MGAASPLGASQSGIDSGAGRTASARRLGEVGERPRSPSRAGQGADRRSGRHRVLACSPPGRRRSSTARCSSTATSSRPAPCGASRSPLCSPARAPSASAWARSCTRRSRPSRRPSTPPSSTSPTSLRQAMWEDETRLDQTGHTQPALFAFEVALYRLLESYGFKADHGRGPFDRRDRRRARRRVLSLEDAAKLVTARARLMQKLPAGGVMIAIQATEAEVVPRLTSGVSLAAVNAEDSVVIAGVEQEAQKIVEQFNDRKTKRLAGQPRVPLAADGAHARRLPRQAIAGISFNNPTIPLITHGMFNESDYWVGHVRDTVRFKDTVDAIADATHVEIGPSAVLAALVDRAIPTMRTGKDEVTAFITALAKLYTAGAKIAWPKNGTRIALPTYPFDTERFWPQSTMAPAARPNASRPALYEPSWVKSTVDAPRHHGRALGDHRRRRVRPRPRPVRGGPVRQRLRRNPHRGSAKHHARRVRCGRHRRQHAGDDPRADPASTEHSERGAELRELPRRLRQSWRRDRRGPGRGRRVGSGPHRAGRAPRPVPAGRQRRSRRLRRPAHRRSSTATNRRSSSARARSRSPASRNSPRTPTWPTSGARTTQS